VILLLTDVHARFHVVNAQIEHAEQRLGHPLAAVLVLGDMGIFEGELRAFFRDAGQRFLRPLYFIEGNHEDFAAFNRLLRTYADAFTHLPRSTAHAIDGHRFLALGGAAYMDPAATPPRGVVEPADIAACLRLPRDAARIILSHDCPAGLGVPNSPGFEQYGPPGFPGGDRLAERFRPKLWFFGHHHKWFDRTLGATRYIGLPESWEGYALLGANRTLRLVRHRVHVEPSRVPKLLRMLGF
jgi:hypothetical protein